MTVTLEGAPNFRDLGGMATLDGRKVRARTLFRSEGPAHFTAGDVAKLSGLGIRTVCDLRSDGERKMHPNSWCSTEALLNVDINIDLRVSGNQAWDLVRANPTVAGGRAAMTHNYRGLGLAMAEPFRTLVDHMLDRNGTPIMIHCTGGKDRTGVIVALLLHALGVPADDVMADYELSTRFTGGARFAWALRKMFDDLNIPNPPPELVALMAGVEGAYLNSAMDALLADGMTLERLFEERIGLDQRRRGALQDLCLE
jgi:protein-tyrosine phosphatase